MKLARLMTQGRSETVAVVREDAGRQTLIDILAVAQAAQMGCSFTDMDAVIQGGLRALSWIHELLAWSEGRADAAWEVQPQRAQWLTPVSPRPVIAAGRNFKAHREESRASVHASADMHAEFPTGFVKLPQTLVPHGAMVAMPPDTQQLDHEVEVALVLAKPLYRASRVQARDAIFGYTVFNDLSARDWQMRERKNQLLLAGKNFPGAGPIGPCILTADEMPDPAQLALSLHVNGELRQRGTCADLLFPFDELVSFWSRMGLSAGDVIATGTPEGVALHRKPDPTPFFLKPGDVVRASVDQIGGLEVTIAPPLRPNP